MSATHLIFLFTWALLWSSAAATHEGLVACSVCRHAIEELWHYGTTVKKHCEHEANETRTDDECNLSQLSDGAIVKHSGEVCRAMAFKYAVHDNQLHLDRRDHEDTDAAEKIERTCNAWLTAEHTADKIAQYISSNVNYRKEAQVILPRLQHRFCKTVCNLPKIPDRKKRHANVHREKHVDYSHALRIEEDRDREAKMEPERDEL